MHCTITPDARATRRKAGEKGSSAYTFLGVIILVAVVVGAVAFFPWAEIFRGGEDRTLIEANKALSDGKWKDAAALFEKSLKANPANPAAYIGRSRAFVQLGDLDKALEEASLALKCDPKNAVAYAQKGVVEKLQGNQGQALKDLSEAVKLSPAYSWAYAQRADVLLRTDKVEEALENVTKAIQLKPGFVEAILLRARISTRMGKCKEAFDDFSKAEQLRPNDAMSLQDKAWFLLTCPDEKLQDSAQAVELAKKAYNLSGGKEGLVLETLAEALFRQGDPQTAVEHQKKAIELQLKRCPDGSCVKEMRERLLKYELAARQEMRKDYEILPLYSGS